MSMAVASKKHNRIRNVSLTVALLLTALVVAVVITEGAVRLVAPQQLVLRRPDVWQPVDSLGWAHRSEVQTTIHTGERVVEFVTDNEGYRVGKSGRLEAATRILILGDSYMEAIAVQHEQSVPGLLEANLQAPLGRRVAVRNAGVSGWDPSQYLIQARKSLRGEDFDLALVALFVGNDVVAEKVDHLPPRGYKASHHPLRIPRALTFSEIHAAVLLPIRTYLEPRSHLFQFLRSKTFVIRNKLGLTTYDFPEVFLLREADSAKWEVTAGICRDIAEVAASYGVPVLFVLVPTYYQVDRTKFDRFVRAVGLDSTAVDLVQPNRLLTDALRALDLDVLDPLRALQTAHRNGLKVTGDVDWHLSPDGHAVVARYIEPAVVALLGNRGGSTPD